MKNFFEKLLDLIYDYIDYIIMIVIIILVVAIIGWRLDIIFTDNSTSIDPPMEEVQFDDEDNEEVGEGDEEDETSNQGGEEIEIEIPSGTLPPDIASILLENQLIDDDDEFLSTVQEQDLEGGLKAGEYVIPSGSSIDEILDILTN